MTQDGAGSIRIVDVEAPEAGVGRADDALALPIVVSRHPGQVAWSPDGRTLLVTDLAERDPGYNGQPRRGGDTGGPTFPAPTDLGARFLDAPVLPGRDVAAAPRRGPHVAGAPPRHLRRDLGRARPAGPIRTPRAPPAWRALRDRHRPRAAAAADDAALEDVTDALIAEAPPIGPAITSRGGIVVSAHPLASEAGARVLRAGGNAIDAAIAASFALGVVEPDASGIGGDGMALVWRAGIAGADRRRLQGSGAGRGVARQPGGPARRAARRSRPGRRSTSPASSPAWTTCTATTAAAASPGPT